MRLTGIRSHRLHTDAENIARADLPAEEAAANVATLRRMIAQQNDFKGMPPRPKLASVAGT